MGPLLVSGMCEEGRGTSLGRLALPRSAARTLVLPHQPDCFSLGVVVAELTCRQTPGQDGFLQRRPHDLFEIDFDSLRASACDGCPPSLMELAVQCCGFEADERPCADVVCDWLEELEQELLCDARVGSDSDCGSGADAVSPNRTRD